MGRETGLTPIIINAHLTHQAFAVRRRQEIWILRHIMFKNSVEIFDVLGFKLKVDPSWLLIAALIIWSLSNAYFPDVVPGLSTYDYVALATVSMFGLFALAGVVVNDSLIMVDFVNKARAQGVPVRQAVIESGTLRFRAIILTSFTTAAGLLPILFEKSSQAQYVIPTAISISFGIIFATVITLFLIPALYMLQEDFFRRMRTIRSWLLYKPAEAQPD